MKERTFRQKEIIEAARRIISQQGVESLTVREIAKELDITNAALYKHFENKQQILSLLIDDVELTMLTVIERAAIINGNPLDRLRNIFLSHVSYSEQMRGTSFAIINEVSAIKERRLRLKMFKTLNRYLNILQNIIQDGKRQGCIRKDVDTLSASLLFFGSLQSLVTLWGMSGNKFPIKKHFIDGFFDIYQSGIIVNKNKEREFYCR